MLKSQRDDFAVYLGPGLGERAEAGVAIGRGARQFQLREPSVSEPVFKPDNPCLRPSIAPYCERVRERVSPRRFEHIVRVATLAETIARANAFTRGEIRATVLAAMLHDVARDLPAGELFKLAPPESELEARHPLALHGRAGRRLAESWGVTDERVLEAIEGHVFGVPQQSRVGMAVYVADVSEPGRGVNDDIRELAMSNLFRAYQQAVGAKVKYLNARGKPVHPATLRVYREICEPA